MNGMSYARDVVVDPLRYRLHKDGVGVRLNAFVVSDLNHGIPPSVGRGYDVVLAADVIEYVRHPDRLLAEAGQCVHERGRSSPA